MTFLRPTFRFACAIVVGLVPLLFSSPSSAETWQEVYRRVTPSGSGDRVMTRSVDMDSIRSSGIYVRFTSKESFDSRESIESMAVDCLAATRGHWTDLRMYSVYPGTVGGEEARTVCQAAARGGVIASAGKWPVPVVASPSSEPFRPVVDPEWITVSSNGLRRVEVKSLSTSKPFVSYRLWYGDGTERDPVVKERTRFAVEVDCNRRVRRDVLLKDAAAPSGPFSSVDDWGTPFVEEVYNVCRWAEATWQQASAARVPDSIPRSTAPAVPFAPSEARSTGSGFTVGPRFVITNYHVIEGCKILSIRRDTQDYPATVRSSSERNDLALLAVEGLFPPSPSIRAAGALGEDIMVAGHPLDGLLSSDLVVTSGQVNSLAGLGNDPSMLQISAPVQPGNSGGPLIDRSGAIVGVVVSKLNVTRLAKLTGDIAQNVNFAIKPEVLRMFLDANRVPYKASSLPLKRLDGVEIAERARAFTVQVACTK